ncbi:MAG: aminotransferase class V-fold PLP-dependent enzyme [Planctomycetaceae bacterium]
MFARLECDRGVQPVEEICQVARERESSTLIDAAQTVGHLPLDDAGHGLRSAGGSRAFKGLLARWVSVFCIWRKG